MSAGSKPPAEAATTAAAAACHHGQAVHTASELTDGTSYAPWRLRNYINGAFVDAVGGGTVPDANPATGRTHALIARSTGELFVRQRQRGSSFCKGFECPGKLRVRLASARRVLPVGVYTPSWCDITPAPTASFTRSHFFPTRAPGTRSRQLTLSLPLS
jgi:hypothetical protein